MSDIDALAAALDDPQRGWREKVGAVKALGESGDPGAVIPLQTVLQGEAVTLAARAAVALGKLGDRRAVPALTESLLTDDRRQVRMVAAEALGRIGDPSSAEALRQASSDRVSAVRSTAQTALRKIERATGAGTVAEPVSTSEMNQVATGARSRRGFNLPFVLTALVVYGAVTYWVGGPDALKTALPVLIGAAVLVVAVNLGLEWWRRNRS
jgi:HEAT repeat protein